MPNRAIRHSAAHPDAGVSRPTTGTLAGTVAPGKWRSRYHVPPYAGYSSRASVEAEITGTLP
jgi:hypothetical protein